MAARRILPVLSLFALMMMTHTASPNEELDQATRALNDPSPPARRAALLRLAQSRAASIDLTAKMLQDKDLVVRRTAARVLARLGTPALPALTKAIKNDDIVVRRTAVLGLSRLGPAALPAIGEAIKDDDALVRQSAVVALASLRPCSEQIVALLKSATADESENVQTAATRALAGVFEIVESIRLPADGWAFKLDPDDRGRKEAWYRLDLDESDWSPIVIEKAWQDAGIDYIGAAWYRRRIDLPKKPDAKEFLLHFGGVDEAAWVWVNGKFAGEHDVGPAGWDDPFSIDVTDFIRWGETNQITVRAQNTAAKGGIWRPITLQARRLRQ